MLPLFFCGEFPLHIPCWFLFSLNLGSFSYTSRAGFNFMNGLSLRDLMLPYFYRGSFSYTPRAGFTFIWGFSLTHPVLASFLFGEFLLHIPCWLHFYRGSFSYTSRAGFNFISGLSLEIPCWLHFYRGLFLTHPVLA